LTISSLSAEFNAMNRLNPGDIDHAARIWIRPNPDFSIVGAKFIRDEIIYLIISRIIIENCSWVFLLSSSIYGWVTEASLTRHISISILTVDEY
jgi:hypothetical protein